jgi:hypothetical protein
LARSFHFLSLRASIATSSGSLTCMSSSSKPSRRSAPAGAFRYAPRRPPLPPRAATPWRSSLTLAERHGVAMLRLTAAGATISAAGM